MQDRLFDLPGSIAFLERSAPTQQFVEHDAKAIHVDGGRDRLAANLFRRGVFHGHEPRPGSGSRRLQLAIAFLQLRDPEIQNPQPPGGVHEDVAGFQVPVDDQVAVGVSHGVTKLKEQLQPVVQSEVLLVAVVGQRLSVDVFHRQVGRTAVGDACIV